MSCVHGNLNFGDMMNLITAEKCKAMKSGFKQLAKPNGPMGFYTNPNGDVHKEEADLQRELQLSGFLALKHRSIVHQQTLEVILQERAITPTHFCFFRINNFLWYEPIWGCLKMEYIMVYRYIHRLAV